MLCTAHVLPDAAQAPVRSGEIVLDLDCWEALQFPSSVLTAALVCRNGVKRAHLVSHHNTCTHCLGFSIPSNTGDTIGHFVNLFMRM